MGKNPDSLSPVRGANIGRSEHAPLRIVPERGQVTEHGPESPSNESWRVFHEAESWSYLANDAGHFSPEPRPRAVDTCPGACDADVLAREAARDDIHESSPRTPVEGGHVIPHWEGLKAPVVLSGHEHGARVSVKFDGTDGSPPEFARCENAASSACEKCQLIHPPALRFQTPAAEARSRRTAPAVGPRARRETTASQIPG